MIEKKNDDLVDFFVEPVMDENTINYICEYKFHQLLISAIAEKLSTQ
jgi:hypothetical protein